MFRYVAAEGAHMLISVRCDVIGVFSKIGVAVEIDQHTQVADTLSYELFISLY